MLIEMAERRWLPDGLVRAGMRRLLRARLQSEQTLTTRENRQQRIEKLFAVGPIAIETTAANAQHYEIPAEFFRQMLGPRCKYSSCWWEDGCNSLADAEAAMLRLTCERAEIADGQQILELGCGWGSLTLWLAEQFPQSRILAVTNSSSQQEFIRKQCREQGLDNVEVRVVNVEELDLAEKFDRMISVEMFEHMRNWQQLLANIAGWLAPGGKCFLHTFCHRELFYPFEAVGSSNWMAQHFFTGGVMPSYDLLRKLDTPLEVQQQWPVNGNHYAKTCRAWLANLDANTESLLKTLGTDAQRKLARWRMFVMACEELFAFDGGEEWFVSHALLRQRADLAE